MKYLWKFLLCGLFFSPGGLNADPVIIGPENVEPGRLAVFETPTEGAFQVWPGEKADFAVDSSSKRLFFVSPSDGWFTVIFAAVEEGTAVIYSKEFCVGETSPSPDPEPDPGPDTLSKLSVEERRAVKSAAQSVLNGIRDGIVKMPNHARMEFKRLLTSQLKGTVSENVSVFLTELSADEPIGTLADLQNVFTHLTEEIHD